jgi:membrane protease YdiL (CAAX protease family)
VTVVIFLEAYLLLGLAGPDLLPEMGAWRAPVFALIAEAVMLLAAAAAVWAGRRPLWEAPAVLGMGRPRVRHLRSGLLGYVAASWAVALTSLLAVLLYRLSTGQSAPAQQVVEMMPRMDLGPRLVMAAVAVVVAPVSEELLFRGVLFGALRERYGFWSSALTSGILFGLIHMSLVYVLPLSLLGVILAWLYERTGSLWPPIVLHVTQNALVLFMLFSGLTG